MIFFRLSILFFSLCFLDFTYGGGQSFFWQTSLNVNSSSPSFSYLKLPLLSEPLSVSLSSNSSTYSICICDNRKPPQNSSKWSTQCHIYFQVKGSETNTSLNLIPSVYWIGISSSTSQNVSVTLQSFECLDGFWGANCSFPHNFHLLNPGEQSNFTFSPSSLTIQGRFTIPSRSSYVNLAFSTHSTPHSPTSHFVLPSIPPSTTSLTPLFTSKPPPVFEVALSLRHGNTPYQNVTDYSLSFALPSNQNFSLPQPGDWFFSITLLTPETSFSEMNVKLSMAEQETRTRRRMINSTVDLEASWGFKSCKRYRAGNPCQLVTRLNSSNSDRILERETPAGQWEYFLFSSSELSSLANETGSFNFSVQSFDGALHFPPDLYLGFNQVPTTERYEVMKSKNLVNSIQVDSPSAGNWYFAVKGVGRRYVVWFNGRCPGGCNGHDCMKDGDLYRCKCPHAFDLFNCTQNQDGMKSSVFAAILVGYALLMVSIFAGLIWICNRNVNQSTQGYIRIDQENIVS